MLFLTFHSSPLNLKKIYKPLLIQLSLSNTKVFFLRFSTSYGVKSRFYLPANLLN